MEIPRAGQNPDVTRMADFLSGIVGMFAAVVVESLGRDQCCGLVLAAERIVVCRSCGNVDTSDPCTICRDETRDPTMLVVVEDVSDLWALERSGAVKARYHVLGGVLSALDGVRPEHLTIARLVERASEPSVKEIILALNATVDGQTTAHYVTESLKHLGLTITRLAHGVPVGGELDYLDEGTLTAAIRSRTAF